MEKRLKLVIWRGLFCVPTFFPSPSKTRRNLFGMFVKSDCHPRSESTFRQIDFDFQFFIEVLTLPSNPTVSLSKENGGSLYSYSLISFPILNKYSTFSSTFTCKILSIASE